MISTIIGQLLLGWLLADLLTGAFHWWEDSFGTEDWPLLGPWLIAPNRLHHADPLAFTRHGFWPRNRASIATACAVGAAWSLFAQLDAFAGALLAGVALSNEVHRYAHQPSAAPRWVRVLQQTGVIQSAKGHAVHHRPPQLVSYCVLTDWLNPILEEIGFWRRLERLLGRTR